MSTAKFLVIIGTVWIAPHLPQVWGAALGVVFACAGIWEALKEAAFAAAKEDMKS